MIGGDIMYYLCENVYLVNGAVNAAVYDLTNNRLYQLPKPANELLHKCLKNETDFSDNEKQGIQKFIDAKIITIEYVAPHDIKELSQEIKIDFAWLEITTKCNYKCIHCYEEATTNNGNDMDYKDFCHAIDELQEYGVRKIQVIGGEPCILGNKLLHYLDYAVGKFDAILIYTNGSLVTDEMISYFYKHNIIVLLSVYSYDHLMHDSVTQVDGSHSRTVNTIAKLKQTGIRYIAKNVIMKGVCPGNKNTDLYELNPRKDIVRLTGRANWRLLTEELLKKKLITQNSFARPLNKNFVSRVVNWHNCFGNKIYIGRDMEVYPCVMERRISHGNLRTKKLQDVIKSNIRKMNKDYIEECKECELRYACADCRPDSLGNGINEKPWQCTYSPLKGTWHDVDLHISNLRKIADKQFLEG